MGEVVHQLGKADLNSARRASFVAAVALSFERYVAQYGAEPDALMYVIGGIKQPSRIAWDIQGESRDGPNSFKSLAAMHVLAEIGSYREEVE